MNGDFVMEEANMREGKNIKALNPRKILMQKTRKPATMNRNIVMIEYFKAMSDGSGIRS